MNRDIYLDNAATSWPKPPVVIEAMRDFLDNAGGSPGRAGHRRSIASSRAISLAREQLSELLGIESPDELAFTKNATEGLNVAILGFARDGSRVVTTTLEHNSVMRPLRALEQQGRITLDFVHADGNTGEVDLDAWRAAVGAKNVSLAVAVHAANVTGVLLPLADMAARANEVGVPFVADTSQSAGHVPLDLAALGVSAAAMPGHKGLLGPMGTGVLYVAPGVEVDPLIRGGSGSKSESEYQPDFTPDRYESGTLNGIGIVALGAAATYIAETGVEHIETRLAELTRRFRDGLADAENLTLYGPTNPAASVGIVSVNVRGVPCATAARLLDDEWGVMTRAGLHCSPAAHRSLGTAPEGTIRFSWSHFTTDDEIDVAIEAITKIAAGDRSPEPVRTIA
jgi:cysteine desulfurase family protein